MAATLAECSPEFSVLMGYWIVGADVETLYDLGSDVKQVTITNPHLYLGNPSSGTGFISEEPFEGTVTVDRGDLRTDKDAFGYSVESIYGGLNASQFEAEITPVVPQERIVIGVGERSPVIVSTMGGAGDIEVQLYYTASGKQVLHIDTEDGVGDVHVLLNGARAFITKI